MGRLGRGHSDLVHAEVADADAGLLAQGVVAPHGQLVCLEGACPADVDSEKAGPAQKARAAAGAAA